jgi:16S rRNA (adenine1518-N6/adenine1519-N6)-dimethyltransferase
LSDEPLEISRSPRQTYSYLRTLFEERGIKPRNKLGQNFLIDLNLLDLLVRVADLTTEDLAVEIGSGTGSLTTRLAEQAGAVLSVEIDPAFAALTQELVAELPTAGRVTLLHTDVLRTKNELNSEVLLALENLRQVSGCTRLKLVANLPYAVATPVISNFLLSELPFVKMVVMVQWEIAERLTAEPGSKDYGALSVLVQSLAKTNIIRKLHPKVFFPRPKVESAIVKIVPDPAKRAHAGDVWRLRNFLRDLYAHRRKNLRGGLAGFPGRRWSKSEIDAKLTELGIDGTVRAETLGIEDHLRLCAVFGSEPPVREPRPPRKRRRDEEE